MEETPVPPSLLWKCPECEQGKTQNCDGFAWDFDADERVPCAGQQAPR